MKFYLKCLFLIMALSSCSTEKVHKPMYRYRYQTEDVMKTAESGVPFRGYHVVEGGYYPELGYNSGLGFSGSNRNGFVGGAANGYNTGNSGFGPGGYNGPLGFYPQSQFIGGTGRFTGTDIGIGLNQGKGGEFVKKELYNDGKKEVKDEGYQKASGEKEQVISHGKEGTNHDKVALQNAKGDSGYYKQQNGEKKSFEDGKQYNGDKHYNQEGKNEGEKKQSSKHKKGHVIKGFKSSHHKDETGRTEEYYDEEHDEGDDFTVDGKSGSFGEKAQSSFKGGQENGQFNAGEQKKEGHFNAQHIVDKSNADKGQYGEKKYSGSGEVYGHKNGIDEQSLLGHQEANKIFKHVPYHIPFY